MNNIRAHSLVDLLRGYCKVPAALDTHLSGVSIDSRKVKKGDLFIAVAEDDSEQKKHILQALELGANAVLREGSENSRVHEDQSAVEICLPSLSESLGDIVARFFGEPSKHLKVIGVTGTNGKTSVSNYLAAYLSAGQLTCGVMGTLGYGLVGEGMEPLVKTGYTTPDVVEVHANLAKMKADGADVVVMEVSSHGLCQGRVDSVEFYGAIFTNLTREHLDYHGSMASYAEAKQQLFKANSLRFAVLNRDDRYFEDFKSVTTPLAEVKSYACSSKAADVSVLTREYSVAGTHALVKTPFGQVSFDSALLGEFNLSNLLAVVAAATAMGDLNDLESRVSAIKPVDGRMELIRIVGKPSVVVDYAHTPDALENVLQSLKDLCEGSLRVIFGCGGDRDQGKRAEMAKVAERWADDIIVTDDNPRGESPDAIIADIISGFRAGADVSVVRDRREAIDTMLQRADIDDVVLVAGKGHETWQEVKGERFYFSDREEVKVLLDGQGSESREQEAIHD